MKPLSEENFEQVMADVDAQRTLLKSRRLSYIERSISKKEFANKLDDGWYVLNDTLKTRVKIAKNKSQNEIYEDEIWLLLSKLGFRYISRDRNCRIKYASKDSSVQQIDILAVDDECALIVECKSADSDTPIRAKFKTQIESLGAKKSGIARSIRRIFGRPNLKIAYLLATQNYRLSRNDLERLETFGIRHLSRADLDYYGDLVTHLGTTARYQFHADMFPKQDIPEMDNRVYAIEGKMGGHKYYSFSIQPEKLLKIGYILHRSKSIKLLPSYQRLIKKPRLSKIKAFVNNGGFFPNSIIISVESGSRKKPVLFEPSATTIKDSITRHGVLHLPSRYRSAYIIDGQHRLYAYGDSDFSESNSIPVVAFIDLERTSQLELFMQINENQKAVSRNLKHTLDADLKWDSPNLRDRAEGLKKQLAQDLGQDVSSPLYERVLVGEDQRTDIKIITLDAILKGINQTRFVGKFTKSEIKEHGIFNTGQSEKTLNILSRLFISFFDHVSEELEFEWRRTQLENGMLTINDGITALIMLLGDIVEHMAERSEVVPLVDSPEEIAKKASYYLIGIRDYFNDLNEAERADLRTKYGSGAPTRLRRIFQQAINNQRDDFEPDGLAEYWRDQSKIYNLDTFRRISEIELSLREDIKETLISEHGNMWLKKGLPEKLYTHLNTEAAKKNRTIENSDEEKTPWDCLNLIHNREIISHQNHWSKLFQKRYTIPGQESLKKDEKTKWITKLNEIRNKVDHEYSVAKEEAEYISALHDWLIMGEEQSIKKVATEQEQIIVKS